MQARSFALLVGIVEQVYGGKDGVAGLVATGQAATAKGGEIIPAAGPVGAKGALMPLGGYYYEPSRGRIPQYGNKWNQASWEGLLTYPPADDGPNARHRSFRGGRDPRRRQGFPRRLQRQGQGDWPTSHSSISTTVWRW
jgi:hypothetical protein